MRGEEIDGILSGRKAVKGEGRNRGVTQEGPRRGFLFIWKRLGHLKRLFGSAW